MASTQALSAAAQDRKARLAQLKTLKRKQPEPPDELRDQDEPEVKSPRHENDTEQQDVTSKYISGRNYDRETRGAKLGFENVPSEGKETLEKQAAALAAEAKRQAKEEEKADKPLDLFKLQPKKPNWDLKRELDRKLDILNVRTDNAIARLVRERIAKQQREARARAAVSGSGVSGSANGVLSGDRDGGDDEAAGIEGTTLVEAANIREREDEEDARREREEDEALLEET